MFVSQELTSVQCNLESVWFWHPPRDGDLVPASAHRVHPTYAHFWGHIATQVVGLSLQSRKSDVMNSVVCAHVSGSASCAS